MRPPQGEIRRLIQLLGDKDYFVRQKAEQELTKIGFAAVYDLADAADSDDMEIVARSAALLRSIKSNWSRPDDPSGVVQAGADDESQVLCRRGPGAGTVVWAGRSSGRGGRLPRDLRSTARWCWRRRRP